MSHQFCSGVFLHNQPAWHRLGLVLDGTVPAREAFRLGGADFPIASRLVYDADMQPIGGYQAITRIDTGATLSVMNASHRRGGTERAADPCRRNLGLLCSDTGELERAAEVLERCVVSDPAHANPWVALEMAGLRASAPDRARSAQERALELEPANPYALRPYGSLQLACLVEVGAGQVLGMPDAGFGFEEQVREPLRSKQAAEDQVDDTHDLHKRWRRPPIANP